MVSASDHCCTGRFRNDGAEANTSIEECRDHMT